MIKILNKILNHFGYEVVKKENLDKLIDISIELDMYHNWNLLHKGLIKDCEVIYNVSNTLVPNNVVVIMKTIKRAFPMMIIKAFPYSKDEDYEYTRMCAEELKDKLNENI